MSDCLHPRRLLRRLIGRPAGSRPTLFVPLVDVDGQAGPCAATEAPAADALRSTDAEQTQLNAAPRHLRIFFIPGYDHCNYRCPYCITGPDHAARLEWDSRRYLPLIDALTRLEAYVDTVELGVGGEPLTSELILEGVRRLATSDRIGGVNLVTNLYWSADRLRDLVSGLPAAKIGMACSYHPSQGGDLSSFLGKVCLLRDLGVAAVAGCLAYPPDLDVVAEMKAQCDRLGLPLFVGAFVGPYEGREYPRDYTDSARAALRALAYSQHDYDYLFVPRTTRGESCGAGCTAVMVSPSGEVYRCSAEYQAGLAPLGHVLRDRGLRLLGGFAPCPADHCFCTAETTNTRRFEEAYVRMGSSHLYRRRAGGARAEAAAATGAGE